MNVTRGKKKRVRQIKIREQAGYVVIGKVRQPIWSDIMKTEQNKKKCNIRLLSAWHLVTTSSAHYRLYFCLKSMKKKNLFSFLDFGRLRFSFFWENHQVWKSDHITLNDVTLFFLLYLNPQCLNFPYSMNAILYISQISSHNLLLQICATSYFITTFYALSVLVV